VSLGIQVDNVTAVLLADGWHQVGNHSFDIDAYEFMHGTLTVHGGGWGGVTTSGYAFAEPDGTILSGPLTAILAVRHGEKPAKVSLQPTVLPDWCGECDGPELEKRWIFVDDGKASKRCPRCNPHAKQN
jgi:hypothetical protein